MRDRVSIMAMATASALGIDEQAVWSGYLKQRPLISSRSFGGFRAPVSSIDEAHWETVEALRGEKRYAELDPSVLLAIHASRRATVKAGWTDGDFGINLGSSRGATSLLEKYYGEFLESGCQQVSTLSSPTTTLGNLSSWVGHDLQSRGPEISHSIACSTSLHAVLNGVAWINSGMSSRFLVGGSEAANTAFTIAQMKALKIYAGSEDGFVCRSMDLSKKSNTMVLGEAAAVFCLERGTRTGALAYIAGIGYATEPLQHNISISGDAQCFQRSMEMALRNTDKQEIDVIVMHAPGTVKGDHAEYQAVKKLWGKQIPAITSNKWIIGHTLGASGGMSMEMALLMMKHQHFLPIPYIDFSGRPDRIGKVLVNAVGFGGNAVSILLCVD